MTRLAHVNLISLLGFYLASAAVISFARRYSVYLDVVHIIVAVRGRWPRLVQRLKANHGVLVTGEVIRPTVYAFGLMGLQMLCSRVIWPQAELPLGVVWDSAWRLTVILAAAIPMLYVDGYFLLYVGRFDRSSTEQYLDLAERWLHGWRAPLVRTVTLGYLNPHDMVEAEVRKGLSEMGQMVSWSMQWVAIQVTCRVVFGLTVWLVWAVGGD